MIIDDKVLMNISRSNIKFYKEKYNCKIGDKIKVGISDLAKGSNVIVNVKCQICECVKKIPFRKYLKNIDNQSIYTCSSKCSTIKKKNTKFINFGDENYNNRKKSRETCISLYGVDNPMKSYSVRKKSEDTCQLKYNSKNYLNSNLYLEKMISNYGVLNPMKSAEINSKRIKSAFSIDLFNDIKYQGSYELDFLKICKKYLLYPIKPDFEIHYIDNSKDKTYIPDFYFKSHNLIIEIKSSYYYNLHKEINILKKEYSIKSGYDYLMILDKNYVELFKYLDIQINLK
jgi:hypothetical protein